MTLLAGPLWRAGSRQPEWCELSTGRLKHVPPKSEPTAWFLEGLYDHHAHLGDAFLRAPDLSHDLATLVAPGTGYKHQMLAKADASTIAAGIRQHLEAMASHGTVAVLDFREQGIRGVNIQRRATRGLTRPRALALGRPDGDESRADVLRAADGLGVPSLPDVGLAALEATARACNTALKPWSIHVSEAQREDLSAILPLGPDLLVHAGAATDEDLRRIRDAAIPVAVCPTSNAHFRLPCAASRLEKVGVAWYLGTDNAMLGDGNLLAEAAHLQATQPDLSDDAVARALTTPFSKSIKRLRDHPWAAPENAPVAAVPLAGGRPAWTQGRIANDVQR